MRISLQPAYVLHRRPYRDTSLLLELFSAEHGRLSLVSRGARRSGKGSSLAAQLQPFAPLLASWSGRGDLKTLTGSESARPAWQLGGDRLYSGLYVNELLMRLLHRHDPHPRLFAMYGETLSALAGTDIVDDALRAFELCLLDELGYGFALTREADTGESVSAPHWYRYEPGVGLVRVSRDGLHTEDCYAGDHLLAMARGEFGGEVRASSKRLLRAALAVQLGNEPLRSRELFAAARRGRP